MKNSPITTQSVREKTQLRVLGASSLIAGFALLAGLAYGWLNSAKKLTQTAETQNVNQAVTATTWQNTNPGGGGAFTSITAGPTGTIIVTSDLSGAYRSLDRGQTWDVIGSNRGLETTHVSAVAFHPTDSQRVLLGTEAGLYTSLDQGQTFQRQPTGTPLRNGYVGAIAFSASTPNTVYAGAHSAWNTTDGKMYKSLDGGISWSQVSTNLPATKFRILKLSVGPTDNLVYALSGLDTLVDDLPADQLPNKMLYKSIDGGISWNQIAGVLGDVVADFTLHPSDPNIAYLTTQPNGFVYKSTDGGNTWTQKTNHSGLIFLKRDQPQVIRTVDVELWPGNANAGVWRSNDGGNNWFKESPASGWDGGWQGNTLTGIQRAYGNNVYGFAKGSGVDASQADVWFVIDAQFAYGFGATYGTSFKNIYTNQAGTGWRGQSLDNVAVIDLAVTEADPARVYSGSYDLGLWRSFDGGQSWQTGNSPTYTGSWQGYGGTTTTVVADPARANVVWASMGQESYGDFNLVRSTDSGSPSSWNVGVGFVTEAGVPRFMNGLSVDANSPANNRTLFITSTGDVYRSQDDGLTWDKVFDCNTCRTTSVDPNDRQVIYAGGEGGFFRSLTGGASGSWVAPGSDFDGTMVSTPDTFQWTGVHKIVPDQFTVNKVYAVVYGAGKGLYVSPDRGSTWTKLRDCPYCRSMAVDRFDSRILYLTSSRATRNGGYQAGTEGVLRSTDGGTTWTQLNEGLAWKFAWPITIKPTLSVSSGYHLLIGSPGTGYFIRDISRSTGGGGGGGGGGGYYCYESLGRLGSCPLITE